jgi:cation-transporting P-type ATPase E
MTDLSMTLTGLTTDEAAQRRNRGQGNNVKIKTSRTYFEILKENVFTFINNVLFGLIIALILVGRSSDALFSGVVIGINIVISLLQEIRAKRTLDSIALLTRPTATILRDGNPGTADPSDIVIGDILMVRAGDQIMVDGTVVQGRMDVDEALLSGESDLIRKAVGSPVYSGSFCVSGSAAFEAQKVGKGSVSNQLTEGARAFRRVLTPIQQETNLVIRVLLVIAVYFELLLFVNAVINAFTLVESVTMSVVIASLVPNGLFVAIAISYALGAVRIARKGALVQQSNAIESLSNVDILCLDKTGTLTANQISFHAVRPYGVTESDLRQALGDFAASGTSGNRTSEAIAAACPGQAYPVLAEAPFSSEHKWSGLVFDLPEKRGTYVLGALEMLAGSLKAGSELGDQARVWSSQGLRVVLFAWRPDPVEILKNEKPSLPRDLIPLGLVSFSDTLRPEARETLAAFSKAGVKVKIISGDDPQTVSTLALQAGLPADLQSISGLDLAEMDDDEFSRAAETCMVFGRVTPQQKEKLIAQLRANGHYVAMIGDGVNDVLSLKHSNLAIAMQSGSQATKAVADIILMGDTFASLPFAVTEGQRIINGMQSNFKLFLSRTLFIALIILSVSVIGFFPFSPKQQTILAFVVVGLPSMALAWWAQPGKVREQNLIRLLLHFVLPAALATSVIGLIVFGGFYFADTIGFLTAHPVTNVADVKDVALPVAQTALTTFAILCGLLLILFVEPPSRFFAAGGKISTDLRPTYLAVGLAVLYLSFLVVPSLSRSFDITPLSIKEFLWIIAAVGSWTVIIRWIWRWRIVDRFISTDLNG